MTIPRPEEKTRLRRLVVVAMAVLVAGCTTTLRQPPDFRNRIGQIRTAQLVSIVLIHPGFVCLQGGVTQQHPWGHTPPFRLGQGQTQAETGWPPATRHTLIQRLEEYLIHKTVVQQALDDLGSRPLAALHGGEKHTTRRRGKQLAIEQITLNGVRERQVALAHFMDVQRGHMVAQLPQDVGLVDQALRMQQQSIHVADHHHIVMESPGVNGTCLLAGKERLGFGQVTETGDGLTGLSGLTSGKGVGQFACRRVVSPSIDKQVPAVIRVRYR